jgi:hypothetical protein
MPPAAPDTKALSDGFNQIYDDLDDIDNAKRRKNNSRYFCGLTQRESHPVKHQPGALDTDIKSATEKFIVRKPI